MRFHIYRKTIDEINRANYRIWIQIAENEILLGYNFLFRYLILLDEKKFLTQNIHKNIIYTVVNFYKLCIMHDSSFLY